MARELSEQQQKFIDALMGEALGDFSKAKKIAGYASNTPISVITKSLKDEIIEAAEFVLVSNAPKAALSMVGVLETPDALGARNLINAAAQVMDRVGIVKKEQLEIKSEGPQVFILPAKRSSDDGD